MTQEQPDTAVLDQTINALQGSITNVDPVAAMGLLDQWQTTLASAGLGGISTDLAQLKQLLNQRPFDGKAIGATLARLGNATTVAAGNAGPQYSQRLSQLGTLLTRLGSGLA